jgi:hypothetical protein
MCFLKCQQLDCHTILNIIKVPSFTRNRSTNFVEYLAISVYAGGRTNTKRPSLSHAKVRSIWRLCKYFKVPHSQPSFKSHKCQIFNVSPKAQKWSQHPLFTTLQQRGEIIVLKTKGSTIFLHMLQPYLPRGFHQLPPAPRC